MLGIFPLLAFAPLALSAPAPAAQAASQKMHVIWKHDKTSYSKGLYAVSEDLSTIYGQSCSDELDSGNFAKSALKLDVDDDGFGNLTYGDKTYEVLMSAEHSGGIECTKMYSPDEAHVDCIVPFTDTMSENLPISAADICLPSTADKPATGVLGKNIHRRDFQGVSESDSENMTPVELGVFDKRQQSCYQYRSTFMVGNGNPHQNFYDKQISETINCGAAPGCSVGHSVSKSYNIGFSSSATIDAWLSGGFSVGKSWTTGNSYTCNGGRGDTVCVSCATRSAYNGT